MGQVPKASVWGDRDDKSLRKQQKAPGRGEETWGLQDEWVLGHSERISVLLCACRGCLGLVRTQLQQGGLGTGYPNTHV